MEQVGSGPRCVECPARSGLKLPSKRERHMGVLECRVVPGGTGHRCHVCVACRRSDMDREVVRHIDTRQVDTQEYVTQSK